MNIFIIVGSLRKKSTNMKIAKTMQQRYKNKVNMTISDIGSLPFFNEDNEDHPPDSVKEFKQSIAKADGVMIVTPEYNWSIPGVLKNALDWTSRVQRVFVNKPVMILGASSGKMGTLRAQLHLREILVAPGIQAKVLAPGTNEITINFVNDKIDVTTGKLTNQETLSILDQKVDAFISFIKDC